MKKWFKYILIAVTIFFIGIVNAKAEDVTNITCTYKLPYTGLDINSNTILKVGEPKSLYFTAQFVLTTSSDGWKISASQLNNYKDKTYTLYPKVEFREYLTQNNFECPKYINLKKGTVDELKALKSQPVKIIAFGWPALADFRVMKPSTEQEFIENLKNNSGNVTLGSFPVLGHHKFIVPLYSVKKEENGKTTEEFSNSTMQKYVDVSLDGWIAKNNDINSQLSYAKSVCTDDEINQLLKGTADNVNGNCVAVLYDYPDLIAQLSNYLDAIGIDGSLRNLANRSKFNALYNQVNSVGAISEKLKKQIDKEQTLDEKRSLLNDVENNKCLGYCNYDNSTSVNYCKSNNTKYSTCRSCYTNKCANKNGTELETCLSECLGQDEYNTLNNLAEQFKSKLSSQIEAVKNQLYKPNIPTLEGISFNQPYKVKCSDFSVLHTLWKIVIVAAPILTILFGVLDFAKSVISSDEEKIKKSWKRFPKRLMALAILIIVPILISIVVNSFTNNEGIKDTSVLKCIVNGE